MFHHCFYVAFYVSVVFLIVSVLLSGCVYVSLYREKGTKYRYNKTIAKTFSLTVSSGWVGVIVKAKIWLSLDSRRESCDLRVTNEGNVVVEYLWTKESCKSTDFSTMLSSNIRCWFSLVFSSPVLYNRAEMKAILSGKYCVGFPVH